MALRLAAAVAQQYGVRHAIQELTLAEFKAELPRHRPDVLLVHGNATTDPHLIADQVDRARAVDGYRGQPVVFNEDDHFDFERPWNNFVAAISRGASWGYFDYRMPGANGVVVVETIKAHAPNTQLIMFTNERRRHSDRP